MASVAKRTWSYNGVEKTAWVVRYQEGNKHRSRQFKTKTEADAYERKVLREMEDGVHVAKTERRTFSHAADLFQDESRSKVEAGQLRSTTHRGREYDFKNHLTPALGYRMLNEITAEDMEAFYRDTIRTKKLSAATARDLVCLACSVFDLANRRRFLKGNPARIALKEIAKPRRRIEVFSPEEVRHLLATAAVRPPQFRRRSHLMLQCAVNLAAFCGLRWGEVFGLTRQSIDFERGTILIRHSLDQYLYLRPPKTEAGVREIFVPEHVMALIRAFTEAYPSDDAEGVVFTTAWAKRRFNSDYVNPNGGARLRANLFHTSYWLPLLKRAGIDRSLVDGKLKGRHFHALRHFAASWMIEHDWSVPEVQAVLGHSDPAITLRVYSHIIKTKSQTRSAVQNLASNLLHTPAHQAA